MEATSKATWIWYPGDFEIWLGNIFNNRRTERGAMFPPFWKQDSHWVTVEFSKTFQLEQEESVTIACEGSFNLMLDGKLQCGMPKTITIPAGEHKLNLKVWNQATPPSLFIDGHIVKTDSSWLATYEDKIWIDENGVAHGSGVYVPAASWCFNDIDTPPSCYHLSRAEIRPISCEAINQGRLYDFGRETFGYLKLKGLKGTAHIYYGESREEALDKTHCETLDILTGSNSEVAEASSKAFRYVYIEKEGQTVYDEVTMDYEFAPVCNENSGSFCCSDDELNAIWDVAAYTMDLTTREFFVDGIKRDRWVWSGDAIQSYLMNYYLRFDVECVKRTIRQLRGKDPVTAHINTIMDYTFYWFKSILDYYQYTDDIDFVREIYPRMMTLMDYVLGRTNADGMAEGKADDWIFVDWVDFPMHKRGTLCFEQILFCKSLEVMASCAGILRDNPMANPPQGSITTAQYAHLAHHYQQLAEDLHKKIIQSFWSKDLHAFMHAIEDGQMNPMITKFPNMFAIIFDFVSEEEKRDILNHVMQNKAIEEITTPYMRFYELEALCIMGLQDTVLQEIKSYWGGMLHEGATSFWEKYIPTESGAQHLSMYGRPYGKSLCHAWGASPIYLLGKYFLGVRPTKPGYSEFEVRPNLGRLQWMKGDVPTPFGPIHIEMNAQNIKVRSNGGKGTLIIGSQRISILAGEELLLPVDFHQE